MGQDETGRLLAKRCGTARTLILVSSVLAGAGTTTGGAAEPAPGATANWSAAIEQQIADSEYHLAWQHPTALVDHEAGWQAPNRAHNLRTYFTPDGIRVTPRVGAEAADGSSNSPGSWEWGLTLVGWGRPGAVAAAPPAVLRAAGNRADYDRGGIVEWYVNDRRGLEQGFTLSAPPPEVEHSGSTNPGLVRLELALRGTLSPILAEDGQSIDFATPGGAKVLHYASLVVVDARGLELQAWMEGIAEPGLSGIRLVYDDTGAVYPVTVDPLTTGAAWTAEGEQVSAWFGYSVATAGDVNGDGYSDVIVGAPFYDNGQSDEGRAFVYLGSASGLVAGAAWTAESDQANASFGWSVAPAGDVNGDGYADVLVGAYQYDNGEDDEGRAYLYLGSATGLATSAVWTAEGDQSTAWFGITVAPAGDVNGDGYADVIVGAPNFSNGESGEGRAHVYHGSANGLGTTAAWTAESNASGAQFGTSVATAGDVNGDGFADVIVGAPNYSNGQFLEGRAFVYLGAAASLGAGASWTAESDQPGGRFGTSVATAGDVDGDGYAEVIVGAPDYDNPDSSEGRAYVYRGSAAGPAASPSWMQEGNQAGARFGISVAPAGDVNGDGYADVIVGAYLHDNGQVDEGRASLYLGSTVGLALVAAWTAEGDQPGASLGFSASAAGDVNGDGYSDVLVGAYQYDNGQTDEGRATVYHGSAAGLRTIAAWSAADDQTGSRFGNSVTTAGDVNGDGYSDVIVGAYHYDNGEADEGRAYLFLGSAVGLATTAVWTAEGNQPRAEFGYSVASAGDVNGDGYSDVIVGAHKYDKFQGDEGRVYVYFGSAAGLHAIAAWTADGDQPGALFGDSVATAGDVNGDGYADVIVGDSSYSNGEVFEGRAYVYLGSAAGLATNAVWTAEGNQAFAAFGYSVASAGDVNGDGYSDVIVGARSYGNGEAFEGRAYVYLGSPAGPHAIAAWIAESDNPSEQLGHSVATAGDVNGDGYSDVIVGGPGYSNGPDNIEGRAYVYLGSVAGLGTTAAWTAEGGPGANRFGWWVSTAGDVNGDGYSDVIVGRASFDGPQASDVDVGRADVYLGSAAGLGTTAAWAVQGLQANTRLGSSGGSAGDVNGDGYSDVVAGAAPIVNGQLEGRAYLYYGGGGPGLDRIPRQARSDGTTPIALWGKSDSESEFRARARGRTPAGRGAVRLEWEAKPLGVPFDGTGIGASPPKDTGLPGLAGSATSFNTPISGLSEGTFYHWRSRIATADPYFPRSPWMSLTGSSVTETKLRTAGCADPDGDGYGALGDPSCLSPTPDCDSSDPGNWAAPGPTGNLRFTSDTTLSWDPPADPGAVETTLLYDTLRSGAVDNLLLAECVESDGTNTTSIDVELPSVGHVFFYLTRGQNGCPQGTGSLGTGSSGSPRVGRECP